MHSTHTINRQRNHIILSLPDFWVVGTYIGREDLWHMPHGITLLTSPRNNDSCYLLFEQPFSGHFQATPCASSYLWFPSHDLLALTKSTHCHFSSRLKGTNASSSSSSYLHSWCSPHDSRSVTKSPLWNSHHECLKLPYSVLIILNSEVFYCRNRVLATNSIDTASAPPQRC